MFKSQKISSSFWEKREIAKNKSHIPTYFHEAWKESQLSAYLKNWSCHRKQMIISTKYGFSDPFLSDPSDPTSKAQNKLKIRLVWVLCGRHKTDNNRNCSVILPREFTTTMIWFPWTLTLKIWWLAFPSSCYIVHISL